MAKLQGSSAGILYLPTIYLPMVRTERFTETQLRYYEKTTNWFLDLEPSKITWANPGL